MAARMPRGHRKNAQPYLVKKAILEAEDIAEQLVTMREWLDDRIEQHEVFGDEVGNQVDYEYLLLCRQVIREAQREI